MRKVALECCQGNKISSFGKVEFGVGNLRLSMGYNNLVLSILFGRFPIGEPCVPMFCEEEPRPSALVVRLPALKRPSLCFVLPTKVASWKTRLRQMNHLIRQNFLREHVSDVGKDLV